MSAGLLRLLGGWRTTPFFRSTFKASPHGVNPWPRVVATFQVKRLRTQLNMCFFISLWTQVVDLSGKLWQIARRCLSNLSSTSSFLTRAQIVWHGCSQVSVAHSLPNFSGFSSFVIFRVFEIFVVGGQDSKADVGAPPESTSSKTSETGGKIQVNRPQWNSIFEAAHQSLFWSLAQLARL